MCQRISRETGRQGGLPVFIWFSLLLGVVLFLVGAGIEKDGAAGCGSVCGVALSGAGAKKRTGSFAACAAGGVGRKTGRRWPCLNGQRRRDGLTAPKAKDKHLAWTLNKGKAYRTIHIAFNVPCKPRKFIIPNFMNAHLNSFFFAA